VTSTRDDDDETAPRVGELVVLVRLPPGLVDDLPRGDQLAIAGIVGKPVRLVDYDEDGRTELEFDHPSSKRNAHRHHTHSIFVDPKHIRRHR
jgi:hypothetical protein